MFFIPPAFNLPGSSFKVHITFLPVTIIQKLIFKYFLYLNIH